MSEQIAKSPAVDVEQERLVRVRESVVARYGDRVAVLELGGHTWALAVPKGTMRKLWQVYKIESQSPDPTTKADAGVRLARALLVPPDAQGKVADEREAFDSLGEDSPALLDILADAAEALAHGPLPIRVAPPPSSSTPRDATPTSPQTG